MRGNILKNLALLSVLVAISSTATAQLVWDGMSSPWTHGTGTATDPYLIETPQNLAWLSVMVNSGSSYSGVYFKQTADFDMNGNNSQFSVIGQDRFNNSCFMGIYDGNFKSISNLVVSNATVYIGLFGVATGATFQKICIKGIRGNANASNKMYVGAICAEAYNCSLIKCSCVGNVVVSSSSSNTYQPYIGGLVGQAHGTNFEQCSMRGDVICSRYNAKCKIGGLIGVMFTSLDVNNPMKINSCYFVGNITVAGINSSVTDAYLGLFVGAIGLINTSGTNYGSMMNCYAVGNFTLPSYYHSDDVMIGLTAARCVIMSGSNSYSGTNFPTTSSSYAILRTDTFLKSDDILDIINSGLDSTVFHYDSLNVNNGYPIFGYQEPKKFIVSANYDASMGIVTGTGRYPGGYTTILQAESEHGYYFSGWGDGNVENPRVVTVVSDTTYTANFTRNVFNINIRQDCSVEQEQ